MSSLPSHANLWGLSVLRRMFTRDWDACLDGRSALSRLLTTTFLLLLAFNSVQAYSFQRSAFLPVQPPLDNGFPQQLLILMQFLLFIQPFYTLSSTLHCCFFFSSYFPRFLFCDFFPAAPQSQWKGFVILNSCMFVRFAVVGDVQGLLCGFALMRRWLQLEINVSERVGESEEL